MSDVFEEVAEARKAYRDALLNVWDRSTPGHVPAVESLEEAERRLDAARMRAITAFSQLLGAFSLAEPTSPDGRVLHDRILAAFEVVSQ